MADWTRMLLEKEARKGDAVTTFATTARTAVNDGLLPSAAPLQLIDPDSRPGKDPGELALPEPRMLLELYRHMVLGRRFDLQATTLTKQGRLAVYPSSHGQDACQVGAVLALRDDDWLFPTYRDTMAIVTRGVDPVEQAVVDHDLLAAPPFLRGCPEEHDLARQLLGDRGIVELVTLCGYYTLVSFTLNGFDVPLPPGETPTWS